MKLNAHQAESFMNIVKEAADVADSIMVVLREVEAVKAVDSLKDKSPVLTSREHYNQEARIVQDAIRVVDYAEEASLAMSEIFSRRKMVVGDPHRVLLNQVATISARLYRNLWEVSLDNKDKALLRKLLRDLANLGVWEDIPCVCTGKSYEKLTSPFNGVVAYTHCFGITFVEYKDGGAEGKAWSVLRSALEDILILARTDFQAAIRQMAA